MSFDLPQGWNRVALGEVADATLGKTPRRADYRDSGDHRIVKYRDLHAGTVDFRETKDAYIADEPAALKGLREVLPGDVLIGASGHDGSTVGRKLALVKELPGQRPLYFVGELFRIRPRAPDTDARWFLHFFASDEGYRALQGAVTGGHLTNGRARQIEIPMAPPIVQRHLCDLCDAVQDRSISSARHLTMARRAIEHFRQSILGAACSGRLTADWRESHPHGPDATDLVSNIDGMRRERLGHKYKQRKHLDGDDELPGSWCWAPLGSLVDVATGATPLRTRADYYGGDIPWVTSGAVNAGTIAASSETITALALRETNTKVFPAGTLLVAMYGEGQTRGRVAELGIDAATNQAVAALLFDHASEHLRPYLKLYLLRNYERIRLLSFGGVQPNLSLGVIRDTPIPVPPLEEQREIVQRVDRLLTLANGLRQRIELASTRIERSSQAVLAKAFRGALLPAGGGS